MSRIHVNRFLGIAPKVNETLLKAENAQIARDARLWSQALSPLHGLALGVETDKPTSAIQTLHRYANNTDWLTWTQDVNAVRGPVANDTLEKLYYTGTDKPRVTTNALYDDGSPGTSIPPASWILGIPAPEGPPVASDVIAAAIANCRTWDGAAFVNETTDINDADANDVPLFLDINDAIYFGRTSSPYNALRINTGTAGTTGAVAWEYWNGAAWTALSGLIDGTNAFLVAGTQDVRWNLPANWAKTVVDGVDNYWVRARVTTALTGTPNLTQAFLAVVGNVTGTVTYVYTFVRKYSDGWVEESAPSPVSNSLSALNERTVSVTVPNGSITTGDYGITHKRLYRSSGSGYFFVTEVAIGTSPADDNVASISLGDLIDTAEDLPWPDGLLGLIGLPNKCLAGFMDNVVYISEPSKPHAYRLTNKYTMNHPVVGLGNIGVTIVAITKARPEIGRGVDPAAYSFRQIPGPFPCTSKRSIASSELGVFWSTPRGMAICDGVSVALATGEFISRKEWNEQFYPTTIHGTVHDGRYYGWFETGLDPDSTKIGGGFILDRQEAAFLSQLGEYVYAAHSIPETDTMHVVKRNPSLALRNFTYQWDADPSQPKAYEWKSKMFISAGLENFAFAQIIGDFGAGLSPEQIVALQALIVQVQAFNSALAGTDGPINGSFEGFEINGGAIGGDNLTILAPSVDFTTGSITFTYWADGVLRLAVDVSSNEPFPMPAGFLAEQHEFQLSGQVEVDQVTIASSIEELASV